MSQVLVNETSLTAIADAIREKNGATDTYKPSEMAAAIGAIPTGGGGAEGIPESIVFSGDCSGIFQNGTWDWAVEAYGDRMSTSDITNTSNMFAYSNLENIPFDINLDETCTSVNNTFFHCGYLKSLPALVATTKIPLPTTAYKGLNFNNIFAWCHSLREVPEDYFNCLVENVDEYMAAKKAVGSKQYTTAIFSRCYSLRKHPDLRMLMNGGGETQYYRSMYYDLFANCHSLDEIHLPVEPIEYTTGTIFSGLCSYCQRLKSLTFAMNSDGSAQTANWSNQSLSISTFVGYTGVGWESHILDYNSGITADKKVVKEEEYQALKNDPDWFTSERAYSRYNHDSAVETINSLPDTSAFLAANGGTNTIKFEGAAGELTDGGAINTLTEEEIAVATAKGWTVTLV